MRESNLRTWRINEFDIDFSSDTGANYCVICPGDINSDVYCDTKDDSPGPCGEEEGRRGSVDREIAR